MPALDVGRGERGVVQAGGGGEVDGAGGGAGAGEWKGEEASERDNIEKAEFEKES